MSKPTRAPWRAGWLHTGTGKHDMGIVSGQRGLNPCAVLAHILRADEPHGRANHALIRAAPLLLEACEAVLKDAETRPGAYLHADLRPLRSAVQRAYDMDFREDFSDEP